MFDTIPTVGTFRLPPDSAGTVRAVARIGYELPEALADIIDNSIDAHARTVTVTFLRDDERVLAVLIGDDGDGMDAATLEQAMQFGVSAHHKVTDLGTFGLGMKSASFSQCRSMTVVSRRDGRIAACRWTTELIGNDWSCARLDPSAARSLFERGFTAADKVPATGTVVAWDRLERLGVPQGDLEPFLSKMFQNSQSTFRVILSSLSFEALSNASSGCRAGRWRSVDFACCPGVRSLRLRDYRQPQLPKDIHHGLTRHWRAGFDRPRLAA